MTIIFGDPFTFLSCCFAFPYINSVSPTPFVLQTLLLRTIPHIYTPFLPDICSTSTLPTFPLITPSRTSNSGVWSPSENFEFIPHRAKEGLWMPCSSTCVYSKVTLDRLLNTGFVERQVERVATVCG
jgi:hypothetical protein